MNEDEDETTPLEQERKRLRQKWARVQRSRKFRAAVATARRELQLPPEGLPDRVSYWTYFKTTLIPLLPELARRRGWRSLGSDDFAAEVCYAADLDVETWAEPVMSYVVRGRGEPEPPGAVGVAYDPLVRRELLEAWRRDATPEELQLIASRASSRMTVRASRLTSDGEPLPAALQTALRREMDAFRTFFGIPKSPRARIRRRQKEAHEIIDRKAAAKAAGRRLRDVDIGFYEKPSIYDEDETARVKKLRQRYEREEG